MIFFIAASPVLLLLLLIFIARVPLFVAAPIGLLYTTVLTMAAWSLLPTHVVSAVAKSFFLSVDIMLVVFGAVFFLGFLKRNGTISLLESHLTALTPDRRIQAILLAWLFGSFIEGTSGFGTPAVVVAPLMVGIGFSPLTAISVCLLANSTAVAFGAVGTPLRIGFAGLDIIGVPERAAFINAIVGMSVPLMILAMVVRTEAEHRLKRFFEAVPWALFAGAAFLVPYLLLSFVGYEFPSVVGAAIGLVLAFLSLKFGFFVPNHAPVTHSKNFVHVIFPYLLLLAFLLLGKFALSGFSMKIEMGGGLSHTLQFFNPGLAFLTVVAVLSVSGVRRTFSLMSLAKETLTPFGKTAVSIFCIAATTYLMVLTGATEEEGMLDVLAGPLQTTVLPFFSVFVGAFGAFIAGSATVSNLLFAPLQVQAAESLGYATHWILALQLVGAGAGNMISLANILVVQAAVGLQNKEAAVMRRLALPCAFYLFFAAIVGLLMANYFWSGVV